MWQIFISQTSNIFIRLVLTCVRSFLILLLVEERLDVRIVQKHLGDVCLGLLLLSWLEESILKLREIVRSLIQLRETLGIRVTLKVLRNLLVHVAHLVRWHWLQNMAHLRILRLRKDIFCGKLWLYTTQSLVEISCRCECWELGVHLLLQHQWVLVKSEKVYRVHEGTS